MEEDKFESAIEIVMAFEKDEIELFDKTIKDNGFSRVKEEQDNERILKISGNVDSVESENIMEFLRSNGVPYRVYHKECMGIIIFDGVREHNVPCDKDWNPLTLMSDMRAVIDLLEKTEEEDEFADMKALVLANEAWIDTDLSNMWRYGMENSVAFSSNYNDANAGIIDVEAGRK